MSARTKNTTQSTIKFPDPSLVLEIDQYRKGTELTFSAAVRHLVRQGLKNER